MKLTAKHLLSPIMLILLTACSEPVVFGIPESAWNCISVFQQQEVIEQYNQEKIHNPCKCCIVEDAQKNIYSCKNKTCFRALPYPYHAVGTAVAYP